MKDIDDIQIFSSVAKVQNLKEKWQTFPLFYKIVPHLSLRGGGVLLRGVTRLLSLS